jgi:NO-binding membrane sensor protein with MHYT domain
MDRASWTSQIMSARPWSSMFTGGSAMALAIAQLHFGGILCDAIVLPTGSTVSDFDILTGDFNAATNAVLRVVSVEKIICDLP